MCPVAWPSYRGNIKDATAAILDHTRLAYDTEFGKTKIFIRSPQTLTLLERKRLEAIPRIVIILQKVKILPDSLLVTLTFINNC